MPCTESGSTMSKGTSRRARFALAPSLKLQFLAVVGRVLGTDVSGRPNSSFKSTPLRGAA